ncbi:hypothetical protein B0H14DRAFT_2581055 [Mycena olivaceomarginata]|nr:hypothetical protein B0H14DRAFT_2581055 [Mycena olivaceomarginata]
MYWLFPTEIPTVPIRISHFMGFFDSAATPEDRFGPAMVLARQIPGLAPFTWGLLHTFCASPNASRKRQKGDKDQLMPATDEDWADDPNDDPNLESGDADPEESTGRNWTKDYPGFSRNPVFTICMLAFVRNRATNILPLILGLFFKISGTSSRVVLMLSNAGVCVSGLTVERLKVRITEDAVQLAVQLMTSGRVFFIIFDNINIFLRKFQQSFVALIAEMIVAFTPGNNRWQGRKDIGEAVADMMPKDRPLPPTTPDARPFSWSKKGVVKFLQQAQKRSTVPQTLWSSIWRIFVGYWLSSNNLRAARRDRSDDINAMERLESVQEASHMIMRTHYGHAVEDPASLVAHKGLLNRKWDANKPNYAAAKSLIRHSLIARILHCVMVINRFTLYYQLSGWQPTLADIQMIALTISTEFATATAAQKAQVAGDDWMAHSIYFIRDSLFICLFGKSVSSPTLGSLSVFSNTEV